MLDICRACNDVSGIYLLGCKKSERVYIGRSDEIGKRIMGHVYILRKGGHYNSRLQADYDRFGENTFFIEIIEEVFVDRLKEREEFWINKFDRSQLYNKHISANTGALPNTASLETRKKISEKQRGEKNHFFGKKHSEETLKKMREAARSRKKRKS